MHTIPKEQMKTVDPTEFGGLALQSCMYTILSDVINVRIVKFLEKGEIVEDEQNGFSKSHSCLHHLTLYK